MTRGVKVPHLLHVGVCGWGGGSGVKMYVQVGKEQVKEEWEGEMKNRPGEEMRMKSREKIKQT